MPELATARPASAPGRAWNFDPRTLRGLALAWAAAVLLAHLLRSGLRPPRLGLTFLAMLVESLALAVPFVVLLSYEPVRAWLRGVPRPHQRIIAWFFFLLVVGQLTLSSRRTFPFPSWTMYGRPEAPSHLQYYRYRGVNRAGQEVEVDPAKLFTFVNVAEIASQVKQFARRAYGATNPVVKAEAQAKVRDWLGAIAAAYNLEHPDAPLTSLEFVRYNWEFRREPASEVTPEPLLRIDVPAGGAQ